MKRKGRGEDLTPEVTDDRVVLGYRGLDGVVRRTLLQFEPRPSRSLPPPRGWTCRCDRSRKPPSS